MYSSKVLQTQELSLRNYVYLFSGGRSRKISTIGESVEKKSSLLGLEADLTVATSSKAKKISDLIFFWNFQTKFFNKKASLAH